RASLLSAPPSLAISSLLRSGERMRPLAAWNWTLAGSTRARSGVITGNALQPASTRAIAPTARPRWIQLALDDRFKSQSLRTRVRNVVGRRLRPGARARCLRHQRRALV